MAFRDFTFPEVQELLGVTLAEADLFSGVAPARLREEFENAVRDGADLATAVNTEKARSEFIIAPILLELRRMLGGSFGLFSGIEFDVDAARGLNGFCDFILTKLPRQIVLSRSWSSWKPRMTTFATVWVNVSPRWSRPVNSTRLPKLLMNSPLVW
jgi:hypothetical protein